MKKFAMLLSVLCLLSSLCACAPAAEGDGAAPPETSDTIRVGVRDDAPGFGYLSLEKGEINGYEVDIARAVCESLGKPMELVKVSDDTRESMLEAGEVDMVVATYTITDERREKYNFSDPYYTDYLVVLAATDGSAQSLADFDGKKVGTIKNTTPAEELESTAQELGVVVEPVLFDEFLQAKQALNAGEVDALFMDMAIILGYAGGDFTILPDRYDPQEYGIATRKSDQEFSKKVNDALKQLADSGKLDEFQAHWEL